MLGNQGQWSVLATTYSCCLLTYWLMYLLTECCM